MFELTPFRRKNSPVVRDMWDRFQDMFDEDFFAPFRGDVMPFRSDIRETRDAYVIEAELPGFRKQDIDIDLSNQYLTIRAKRQEQNENNGEEKMIRRERFYGEFMRRFYIGDVQEKDIQASFEDGVLKIRLPRQNLNGQGPRRIEIQ